MLSHPQGLWRHALHRTLLNFLFVRISRAELWLTHSRALKGIVVVRNAHSSFICLHSQITNTDYLQNSGANRGRQYGDVSITIYNIILMTKRYAIITKLLSRALEFEKKLTVTGSVKRHVLSVHAHAHIKRLAAGSVDLLSLV